jgi:hypothetical protein
MPKGKEQFYGWEIISHLAKVNSQIPFFVAGTDGEGLAKAENIYFLGHLSGEKMKELQMSLPIYIRITKHDGYPYSVIEALSYGSEVIWSIDHECCHFVDSLDNAEIILRKVVSDLLQNGLARNKENISFIRESFSKDKILGAWAKKLPY